MPKIGTEPARKAALIHATIEEIGRTGTLDVPVSRIARRAGMSQALAHYYFDTKSEIFLAAMRHIMAAFSRQVIRELSEAHSPRERLEALVTASFSPHQFAPDVVAAWLVFYVEAQHTPEVARLLNVYTQRLHSNLVHALTPLVGRQDAPRIAETAAALIDGLYIRQALRGAAPNAAHARRLVSGYLDLVIAGKVLQ